MEIADGTFKILLTGTPIEKNIMDVYGLKYFVDETVLPASKTYKKRYFRRPEKYSELVQRVSWYFFRTLRTKVKQYAKIPERILTTLEYTLSPKRRYSSVPQNGFILACFALAKFFDGGDFIDNKGNHLSGEKLRTQRRR